MNTIYRAEQARQHRDKHPVRNQSVRLGRNKGPEVKDEWVIKIEANYYGN